MIIARKIEIDYGHTLPNHFGFCNQLHGHRGKIVAYFEGKVNNNSGSSSEGMIEDFKILKDIMMRTVFEQLDHGFAVWKSDTKEIEIDQMISITTLVFVKARNKKVLITDEPPTAEYLAKWAFNLIDTELRNYYLSSKSTPCFLSSLRWYETPNNYAEYFVRDVV